MSKNQLNNSSVSEFGDFEEEFRNDAYQRGRSDAVRNQYTASAEKFPEDYNRGYSEKTREIRKENKE